MKPNEFLQYILEKINTTGGVINKEEFSQYTQEHSEVWDSDQYEDMFYIITDFLEERIPRRVYSINDLKEDIEFYLNKKV